MAQTICAYVTEIPINECNALVALYNSTDGDNWTINTNWLQTNTPSNWYGVTVVDEFVTQVNLESNNLVGLVPTKIGNLNNLQKLNLSTNHLISEIPSGVFQLINLEELSLDCNYFSGSISAAIGNLTKLNFLELFQNQLSGNIPGDIGNLINLNHLNLSRNSLSGHIPTSIINLSNLTWLDLSCNNFEDTFPLYLTTLKNLAGLNLSHNKFKSPIVPSLELLTNLIYLDLSNNYFESDIPIQLANMSTLNYLSLDYNRLNVPAPYPSDPPTNLETFLIQKNPDWYLTQGVSEDIDTTGGVITSNDSQTTITVPPAAVIENTTIAYVPQPAPNQSTGSLSFVSSSFLMEASDDTGTPIETFTFETPVSISLHYQDEDIVDIQEDTILLYYWNTIDQLWMDAATTCTPQSTYIRDLDNNTLSVDICHFTEFSLLGVEFNKLFLPLTLR